jgi:hypothetical protein
MTHSPIRRVLRSGLAPGVRPLLTARDADRHDLYQRSVQLPDYETRLLGFDGVSPARGSWPVAPQSRSAHLLGVQSGSVMQS